jgi:hypothetical protein
MNVSPRLTGIIAVALLAGALSGCAGSSDGTPTLVETKSPVQLLRNEAASRLPTDLVEGVVAEQDGSTACRTVETDPEGLLRSWRSVVRFELRKDEAIDPQAVIDDLASSFVADGWHQGTFGVASIIELTRAGSETQIHISMSEPDADADAGGEVQLTVSGPCVMTAGAESDEVTQLGVVAD